MKTIKEYKSNMGTGYLISINNEIIKEVNLHLLTKTHNSQDYYLMLNSKGENILQVFYFINYHCQYDTFNSKLQSLQALKLLYSYSEIISKEISSFNNKDFKDFSRFILGQSIIGSMEEWIFDTSRSISTHNVYMATIRKFYKHLRIKDISIFESSVVDITKSSFGILAHTKKRTEKKYQSNLSKAKNNKVPKYISIEEYKRIKEELKRLNDLLSLRDEVIIDLMYLKGLRIGEVLGLTLEDIINHPDNESNMGTKNVIPVGRSDFGITTPAEHSAISLAQITTMFFTIHPSGDSVLAMKYIHNWIDVIREIYFKTHDSIFQDEEKLWDDNMISYEDELRENN